MHLVSQALAWVRAVLFGPPDSGRTACRAALEADPSLSVHLSPQQWAHILRHARRGASYAWPSPELPAMHGDCITRDLVRVYVLPEAERTRLPASRPREARWR
jgi:hypothetical protein